MKKLFNDFLKNIDGSELVRRTVELCRIEGGQTFSDYARSAEHILQKMKEYGFPNAEKILYPADGRTVYHDKIMPLAWDLTVGRLTLCNKERTVAADYSLEPLSVIKGSSGVAPAGETMRIISQSQLLGGEDPTDALVMLNNDTAPDNSILKHVLDLGARGIISDYMTARYETPDQVHWANGCTEGEHWHCIEGDRPFVGFSVTPVIGDKIRSIISKQELKAFVECDGHNHVGEFAAVTAMLPGKRKEELWVIAHAYEPFLDDDSAGVIAGMEVMRQMMQRGELEYSLRIIFTLEVYGFAAYHSNFRGEVLGALNLDALPCFKERNHVICPPYPDQRKPFRGFEVLDRMVAELQEELHLKKGEYADYDDMSLSDCTTGVPTFWFHGDFDNTTRYWHNGSQRNVEKMDAVIFAQAVAAASCWAYEILSKVHENIQPVKIELKEYPSGKYRDYAKELIYRRKTAGFPHDFAAVPREFRKRLPDRLIYGPLSGILTRMDGKKTFAELIQEIEALCNRDFSEEEIKKYIDSVNYLADYGYIEVVKRPEITREDLKRAIREAGICEGDLVAVHASVSRFGYIAGGAKTLINAIADAVGEKGTVMFAALTNPYAMLGGIANRTWKFRPYDPQDLSQIWTGEIGRCLLREFPQAIRSHHATHSWAGFGPLAEECLMEHKENDNPVGYNSPLGKALRCNGKILFAGTGLAPTTFLHYLETEFDSVYLLPALCQVKEGNDRRYIFIEKHLPGHRDFYRPDAENSKFYQRAFAKGLQIGQADAGLASMQVVGLKQLWEIGSELIQQDPDILLCDNPDCTFCAKWKRSTAEK